MSFDYFLLDYDAKIKCYQDRENDIENILT